MTSQCDAVAERLALGESLDGLADHVAGCAGCARLVEMPRKIGAARQPIDPGLGFSARMTVGAQHRIAVRRRRRVAAGFAATVAAGMAGVFVLTREPPETAVKAAVELPPAPEDPRPTRDAPDDLQLLVNLADTGRARRLSANWEAIERPLAGYRTLVEEVQADDVEGEGDAAADVDADADSEGETP